MTVTPSYQVIDITHSNTDITNKVVSISPATDTGTGEIPMMVMVLDAKLGGFITITNGGVTPIADQFTRYRVIFTDQNNITFSKIYLVDTLKPIQNIDAGNRLEVHCFGQEYWLQRLDFAKQFYFADANSTLGSILDIYNVNKGTSQPTITNQYNTTYNQLPLWTANNYLFNVSELAVYSGSVEVVDKLGTSVSNGGANDFFELRFDDGDLLLDPTNPDKITPRAWSSGSTPVTPMLLSPSNFLKVSEITGTTEAYQGTLIKAWGDDQSGSLPTDFSKFRGIDEAYLLFPDWLNPASSGQPYPQNSIVGFDPGSGRIIYRSNINNNLSTPPTNWTIQTEAALLASNGVTGYNPWCTTGNGSAILSSMADPTGSHYGICCFDSNVIVQDNNYYRTFADVRAVSDSSVPTAYKILDKTGTPQFYRGFRILLDTTLGALGGVFAQNGSKDRFGNSYTRALVQNNGNGTGTYQDWDCVWCLNYPANASAFVLQFNYQCSIIGESKNYVFSIGGIFINPWNGNDPDTSVSYVTGNYVLYSGLAYQANSNIPHSIFNNPPPSDARWTLVTGTNSGTWSDNSNGGVFARGNDCFHPVSNINLVQGTNTTINANSAIQITYQWNAYSTAFSPIVMNSKDYYSSGWWFNIRFPFPSTSFPVISTIPVGSLYGGYYNTIQSNPRSLEPATVDSLNMHLTPSGYVGFNQADSEALGTLYGLGFQMKMRLQRASDGALITTATGTVANFKMRAYIFDTSDNIVFQDFTMAFNDNWQDNILPLANFQIYRGRIPLQWGDLNSLVPVQQLNILNVFWWKNIKQIVIQCQEMYDDQGRFKPEGSDLNRTAMLFAPSGAVQLIGTIDALRFVKPLLCTNGPLSIPYVVEPETMQRKNVTNYFQLKQDVLSMSQIYSFRYREYEVTTNLNCFVRFGDSCYLYDPNVVETQTPPDVSPTLPPNFVGSYTGQNTIKLVCKNGSYYLNKTDGGPGGLVTILRGAKRYPPGGT